MYKEVKLLKSYLRKEFPDCYISLRLIKARDYSLSSDIISIKTDISYGQIRKALAEITSGIVVFRKGEIASCYGAFNGKILGITDTTVEFIEIETIQEV